MAISNVDTILNELGWQDGFRIPVANEENKRLEEEIAKKMKLKDSLSTKLESIEERIKMIEKRTSNLKVEQDMNQKLLTAHSAQLETEHHHYRLSCNNESTLRQEARNFEKESKELNEITINIEKDVTKITKKIDALKKAIKYDEKGLQKWEEILNRNEENNQLIEKYIKEDTKKYKELELKRQKLSEELENYRQAIIKMNDETKEKEIILDKTARLYTQALQEYRQIFNQWKESVSVLQQRNNDIEKILREIETLRELCRDKKDTLEESDKFLAEQIGNNKQLEESIKQSEKQLFVMKEEHNKIKDIFAMYETELHIRKSVLKDLTQRTQQMHAEMKRKESQIQNTQAKIEELNKQINELIVKLNDIDNQKLNLEEKTKELEKMIEEQEKRKSAMVKEMNRLHAAHLRTTNRIKELESERKVLQMQYQSESKKSEYLNILSTKDEADLEEKKEALYQVEYELQKSEMKLERLRGHERDKSEAEKKQKKIEELETTLNEKTQILKLLQKQVSSLEHDMRKLSNSLANDNTELERLTNKKQDLILLMEGGEKQLKAAQTHDEELQVEESMLRLKVSQMEKMISNIGDNVYNLEKYHLELEAAVRERNAEITVHEESLIVQKRVLGNECSELRSAIAERKTRIRQLQARYENGIATFGTHPDGKLISTAYLKIQSAQERFLLQEQGDELDETIRKTEQEIQSMENTLRVINACNDKYKLSLTIDEQDEPEKEERRKLDEELRDMEKKMKQKQEELQHLTEDFQKMQEQYTHLLKVIDKAKEQKDDKERHLADLKRVINEQNEKILRADKNLKAVQKKIQNMYKCTGNRMILIQEKEVELREIQEKNAAVLQEIAEFTIRHVEAEAYMKKLLAEKNIELPSISIFSPSVKLSDSAASSIESPLKSTSRTSVYASSRESIGSVVNIEPQFTSTTDISSNKDTKYNQRLTKDRKCDQQSTKSSQHLMVIQNKHVSIKKTS